MTGFGIIASNAMRLGIGNIDHIISIEGNRGRPGQIDLQRRTVAIKVVLPGADDGRNDTGFTIDSTDAIAAGVTDVQIILRVKGEIER